MSDTHRLWIFYHKKNKKEPYAVTDNESKALRFQKERNMKKFKIKILKLEPEEFLSKLNKYSKELLNELPVNSDFDDSLTIMATVNEEIQLNLKVDEIEKDIERIYKHLCVDLDIKDKYKYSIEYLTTTSCFIRNDDNQLRSTIRLMRVFINLFKDTL